MLVDHLADLAGGIQPVQHRHLQVHQDHVEGLLGHSLDRLPTVAHHGHQGIDPAQVFDDELLVDPVVLGQQYPDALQQLAKMLLIPCASA